VTRPRKRGFVAISFPKHIIRGYPAAELRGDGNEGRIWGEPTKMERKFLVLLRRYHFAKIKTLEKVCEKSLGIKFAIFSLSGGIVVKYKQLWKTKSAIKFL
jgi:hypothetical protein